MIIEDTDIYADRGLIRRYSDRNVYLMNEAGAMYSEAVDPVSIPRAYTETDVPIETDGEGLIARMPGYRLVEFDEAADPEEPEPPAAAEPEPALVPDEKQQRIAALEAELSALKETS